MRRSVHMNQEILKEMTDEELSDTCAICLDNITEKKLTTLDGCTHKYCHSCILKWVTEVENTCPQCKAAIRSLKHRNNPEGEQI